MGTRTRRTIESGTKRGRKDSVWGQMGEMSMAGISGWTRDPPADNYLLTFTRRDLGVWGGTL